MPHPLPLIAFAGVFAFTTASTAETITVCASGCDHTSINAAIDAASNGDVIQLAAEVYLEGTTINTDGKALSILGTTDSNGDPTTILNGADSHRVLYCNGGAGITLQDVVIRNGNARSGAGVFIIYCEAWSLTNCTFLNNVATDGPGAGGGMAASFTSGTTSLSGCVFSGNTASCCGGAVTTDSLILSLNDCTFTSNSTESGDGGAIYLLNTWATIADCEFTNNSSLSSGGAIVAITGLATLTDCTFTNNTASDDGGGMYNNSINPTLTDCDFCGNLDGSGFNSISGDAINGSSSGNTFFDASCADADKDGIPDDLDVCPGGDDTADADSDGTPDACDNCPDDPDKTEPGNCGCGVVETILAGDLDCDGDVDAADFVLLRNQIGVENLGCVGSDINGDGTVDGADLAYILSFWGATCP